MTPAEHSAEVGRHRQARLARLLADDGWLTVVGRWPLAPGVSTVPFGTMRVEGDRVTFEAPPGLELMRAGTAVQTGEVRPVEQAPEDRLEHGGLIYELVRQGPRFALRARDLESRRRRDFPGLTFFPPNPAWHVVGRLDASEPPRKVRLAYAEGEGDESLCPGRLRFEVMGKELSLEPLLHPGARRLFIAFVDGTTGRETAPMGRYLYAPMPDADGRVVLDFNLAYNPPCVFTEHVECPLVPAGNRLAPRIEAGEKRFPPG